MRLLHIYYSYRSIEKGGVSGHGVATVSFKGRLTRPETLKELIQKGWTDETPFESLNFLVVSWQFYE